MVSAKRPTVVNEVANGAGVVVGTAWGAGMVDGATRGTGRVNGAVRGAGISANRGMEAACGAGNDGWWGTWGGGVTRSDSRRESRSVGGEEPSRENISSSKKT